MSLPSVQGPSKISRDGAVSTQIPCRCVQKTNQWRSFSKFPAPLRFTKSHNRPLTTNPAPSARHSRVGGNLQGGRVTWVNKTTQPSSPSPLMGEVVPVELSSIMHQRAGMTVLDVSHGADAPLTVVCIKKRQIIHTLRLHAYHGIRSFICLLYQIIHTLRLHPPPHLCRYHPHNATIPPTHCPSIVPIL